MTSAHDPKPEISNICMQFLHVSVRGKKSWNCPKWGQLFFLLIRTLPTFSAKRICVPRIPIFLRFWNPASPISRFPDFQIQSCQPEKARAFSAVTPRWLRGGSTALHSRGEWDPFVPCGPVTSQTRPLQLDRAAGATLVLSYIQLDTSKHSIGTR